MNPRRSFFWKIVYLAGIAAILPVLFWLSAPATSGRHGGRATPGGKLAQLRDDYDLSQTYLGEIDPASETIKLATFGMRGVAALILWEKANEYKKIKDWTNLSATLNQLTKLQPNFVNVWIHQGWNLAYNVSAEFDDYRQRYHWVTRGIDFLKEGTKYNEQDTYLVWYIGVVISQKIGRADEHVQFRRLFRADDDFNGSRPLELRDNWLVGKQWFQRADEMVDLGYKLRGTSPVVFHSEAAMCQMNYADALEDEGTFGEVARLAWQRAGQEWREFGDRPIPTSFNTTIQLNDRERHEELARKRVEELEALAPGMREKIAQQRRAALTPEQRKALDTPLMERTDKQHELVAAAEPLVAVTHLDVARRAPTAVGKKALKLAEEAAEHEELATTIRRYREIVNFDYWRLRARVEQSLEAIEARRLIYDGDRAFAEADLPRARLAYEQGMAAWRKLLDKPEFKDFRDDKFTAEDLVEVIDRYKNILDQLDEPLPQPFILQDVLDRQEQQK